MVRHMWRFLARLIARLIPHQIIIVSLILIWIAVLGDQSSHIHIEGEEQFWNFAVRLFLYFIGFITEIVVPSNLKASDAKKSSPKLHPDHSTILPY